MELVTKTRVNKKNASNFLPYTRQSAFFGAIIYLLSEPPTPSRKKIDIQQKL